tara:strand:+ start:12889 stop:16194 length:3306 start_codon:yes stop_codon:yes gene_type:complete
MKASNINKFGKKEKNKKILEGDCIFPFKYKWNEHNHCVETEKGDICATSVNEKKTLKTFGYCKKRSSETLKKSTKKNALNKTIKTPQKKLNKEEEKKTQEKINLKESNKTRSMNEDIIKVLEEYAEISLYEGEFFKSQAYKKAAATIESFPEDITDVTVLEGKKGIGKQILEKLKVFQKTGKLAELEQKKNNEELWKKYSAWKIFTNIYGIGGKKANELISKDIYTLSELKDNIDLLNDKQKVGLNYYQDLLKRIPREEIKDYKKIFDKIFKESTPPGSKFEIVGSFRREAKSSGDIDIIITNEENNKDAFKNFLDALIEKKIIIEVLSRGAMKSLTIGKLDDSIPRRIDFLYSPPTEYAFATLYFTGSKAFNTVMRQHALNMGYSLNEHALTKKTSGKKDEKVNIDFPTEQSIFAFLNMEYKEPKNRKGIESLKLLIHEAKEDIPTLPIKTAKNKTLKKTDTSNDFKKNIQLFKKDGMDALKMLSEKKLAKILDETQKIYYNDAENVLLTDNEYDIIKEYMEKKYPKNKVLDQIGAPVQNKVKLPYAMPSMDKIKPDTKALDKWMNKYKGPYVISAKLDGVSALYSTENNERKLYTRGNGVEGQDISHLIPYLQLPEIPDTTIRGELIMTKSLFIEKYKEKFSNARNLVSGLVNQKTIDPEKIKDVNFVSYEVIKPDYKPQDQMFLLDGMNIKNVIHETKEKITNDYLSELLVDWRENYEYTIDGIIVSNNEIYSRKNKNPDHAFAFKMVLMDQIAEAKVLNVLWAPSKDGYLKPRIQIEPVELGGAKIEYATAFNAAFVESNKLGIGAIVKLIRSGDVIPHIMEVIEPAKEAKMPDVAYTWNETHIDIILQDADEDETVKLKNMTSFLKDVDGLGEGNVKKLYKAGYDSVPKVIGMTEKQMTDVFKAKDSKKEKVSSMAKKVYESLQNKLKDASLIKLMTISNVFGRGFGEKKIELIMSRYPDILTSEESNQEKIEKIKSIKSIEIKTAEKFVKHIQKFLYFLKDANMEDKLMETKKTALINTSHPLFEKTIVMTGFKDKKLIEILKSLGAKESSSVSKNTFAVIVKDKDQDTGKANAAREKNIPIFTLDEFKNKYNLE